jgi:capsular polysaccharide biosynthesis protein
LPPLREVTRAIQKRWWIVILVPLILVVPAVAASFFQPTVYEASTSIELVVGLGRDVPANAPEGTFVRLQALANKIETEGLTPSVAEEVIHRTRQHRVTKGDLYTNLFIDQIEDTQLLQFSYQDTDPEKTRVVVNQVADAYARQIPEANQISFGGFDWPINARILHYATEPKPQNPNLVRNGLVALAIGLLLGVGLALLVEQYKGQGL